MEKRQEYRCVACSTEKEPVFVKGKYSKEKDIFECEICGSLELDDSQ